MASYCEVCQGVYDIPHPHLWPQRSPLSSPPPPWKGDTWKLGWPLLSPPERGGSGGRRCSRGMSWPRVASRYSDASHVSHSPFLEARSSGRACVGPYVCPCQQHRSASMPAMRDAYIALASHTASHSSPSLGGRVPPGTDGGAGYGDEQDGRRRCMTSPPPPVSAASAAEKRGSPFLGRYCDGTYCSQRRADGNPLQLDYLRRGTGQGRAYVSPGDGHGGEGETFWRTRGSGEADCPSSSRSPCAPVDAREAVAPYRCRTNAERSQGVCYASLPYPCDDLAHADELGSRRPQHLPSSLTHDHGTRYASQRAPRPRSSGHTSANHLSQPTSATADEGGRRDNPMPSVHNDAHSGALSSSPRPPLLPSVTSIVPTPSFGCFTCDAEQSAPPPATFEAPLDPNRHGDSSRQPSVSADPLKSRARDTLEHLVAKIRAEVSKDATLWATRSPDTAPLRSPTDAKPRAAATGKRQRNCRPEKPQELGHAPGTKSYVGKTSAAQAAASLLPSSSSISTGAEGSAAFHVLAVPRSSSSGNNRSSHPYQPSTVPPAVSGQVRRARSHRRHISTEEHRRPSRRRRSSSSPPSTLSTRLSPSSVHLQRTVRRAEEVLNRLKESSRGSRMRLPAAEKTIGCVGDSLADNADAVGATADHGRRDTSAHASTREKGCTGLQSGRARRGHSAPTRPSRPHATGVLSGQSSPDRTDGFSTAWPGATQRVHPLDRAAREATEDMRQETLDARVDTEMVAESHQQQMWRTTQEHRIERLREGLSALCSAVRKDLQKVREEVGRVRAEANDAAEDTRKRMREALATALRSNSPDEAAAHTRTRGADFHPSSIVAAVTRCTPAEQRRLAMLLLPHFRPVLAEMVQEAVQCSIHQRSGEPQDANHGLEQRLKTYIEETVASHQRRVHADEAGDGEGSATAPLWATFSSADAFDAHLRAATRAVLLEEDERRYSLVNENERRHERRVQQLQQDWQETLKTAQAQWKAEWKGILAKEANEWTRRAQAPLQQHADILQDIVKALTRDVTHLQGQQEALSARLSTTLRQEQEMRAQEQTRLAERVEQRVRHLLPREVESACLRFHALQMKRQAAAASQGPLTESTIPRVSHQSATPTSSAAAAAAVPSSAEELRLSIVQPAMEHMRRLLVLHQEMIDATVEDRCRRAENTVEGSRHVWSQNVAELRSRLSALRADVRGALGELCQNLNVASPAL
ncbi:hypothetical protein, conserved [Leishmania tarentolae]|uniref:Uncharacterized protein n=1 Tax=Leishmania tarentolae TaxID=5689 RepID=A0A640KDV0_LEITA|nr:hypothetical protein, conserved [Leishmania tarentolae]